VDENRNQEEGLKGVVYQEKRDVEQDWERGCQVFVLDGEEWVVFH
jgi:hypothetical protein